MDLAVASVQVAAAQLRFVTAWRADVLLVIVPLNLRLGIQIELPRRILRRPNNLDLLSLCHSLLHDIDVLQ